MITRREFGKMTLAGLALPRLVSAFDSTVGGVRLGVQTYSFRDLPRPAGGDAVGVVIKAMTECDLHECELFAPQVEPQTTRRGRGASRSSQEQNTRDDLRKWRLETPLDHFRDI